jgi:predicted Zn finger-like uncharacterized protein
MIVNCPSCDSKYQVADEKVAGNVLRTRCKACGSQILVDGSMPPTPRNEEDEDGVTRIMRPEDRPDAAHSQPPPSSRRWTVQVRHDEPRPMTSEEIVQGVLSGSLGDEPSIWKSGMAKWARIADISELAEAVEAARRRTRATGSNGKSSAAARTAGPAVVARPPTPTTRTRTSKPPPPVRKSVAPSAKANVSKEAPSLATSNGADTKREPADAYAATGDLYAKIAAKIGASKPPSVAPPSMATKRANPSVRPSSAPATSSQRPRALEGVQSSLDPTAAPEDFYSKILAKVRPQKDGSVPPAPSFAPKAMPSAPPPLPAFFEVEIPIDTDEPDRAPTGSAPPGPQAPVRSSSPAPPHKRQEPAITVDIQLPPMEATAENRLASQVALPGAITSQSTPPAALNGGEPGSLTPVVAPSSPPPGAPGRAESKVAAAALTDDMSLGMRATKHGRSRRRGGTIVAIIGVGLMGVVGGVAATFYALKGPGRDANASAPLASAASLVSAQVSNSPAPIAENARPMASGPAAGPGDSADVSPSSSSHARRAASEPTNPAVTNSKTPAVAARDSNVRGLTESVAASKNVKAASETTATTKSSAAAPATKPAKSGTAPFNRDAALAVLGIAASQAASCKRPSGPTGAGKAAVTFDSDGRVIVANVSGPQIAGTPVARCVAALFQRVKVAPFSGDRQTVSKPFLIPQ